MSMLAAVVFWLCAGVLVYVYLLYPLLVRTLARIFPQPVQRAAGNHPSVTVVIAAYNEEKHIAAKIEHVLALDYQPSLLDVLVVSDASSDRTDEIVRSIGSTQVRLLRIEGRVGKTACQNAAVGKARGEIVVFTDATTLTKREALAAMMENFADPQVGCVAGLLIYQGTGNNLTATGGVSYWGYEIALRSAESRLSTLVGVSGCLYAVRKSAYRPIAQGLISDFVIAMRMREQGLRTVLERRAVCFEETLERSEQELSMRVRVVLRSITALMSEKRFLNPLMDPLYAWQLWSHKLLRYACPYCLLATLGASLVLAAHPVYRLALIAQLALFGAGLAGFMVPLGAWRLGILSKPYYFLLTNLASVIAMIRFLRGKRMITWSPIR